MSEELNRAISAIKAGDRLTARRLLIEMLRQNPDDETAWLWMTEVIDSVEGRMWCLQNVLEANPDNETAQAAMATLQQEQARRAAQAERQSRQEAEEQVPAEGRTQAFSLKPVTVAGIVAIFLLGGAGLVGIFTSRLPFSAAAIDASPTVTLLTQTARPASTILPKPDVTITVRPASRATTTPTPTSTPTSTPTALPQSPASNPASDGSKILYLAQPVRHGNLQIRLVNPDGSEPVVIGDFTDGDTRLLDWSRDGRWVLASNSRDGSE